MGIIKAPTYANLTTEYEEIKVSSITHQSNGSASKYYENSWYGYLD